MLVEDNLPEMEIQDMPVQRLHKELEKAILNEDYELAAKIRDEMKRRNVN